MALGHELGRVLSDGRIVGRAEPFAKVFPSSRAVKRAVGPVAWVVLEDIALDARLDSDGRLVAETNVRRIADHLGISKNTVTTHLARLRAHGFVLHEELRDDGSGRYEVSRYVLDPSACLERFTVTPSGGADDEPCLKNLDTVGDPAVARGVPDAVDAPSPCPKNWDTDASPAPSRPLAAGPAADPCPKIWDTAADPATSAPVPSETVSQSTGHRDLGQKNKKKVAVEQQQRSERSTLVAELTAVGVAVRLAEQLVAGHPPDRILDAVDAVGSVHAQRPAGWVVSAIRDGWDVADLAAEQRARRDAHRRRTARHAHADAAEQRARHEAAERRRRHEGWAAAVSAALSDQQLREAVLNVTSPVLGRRSVPLACSQLVAWASAVHALSPDVPLHQALPSLLGHPMPPTEQGEYLHEPPALGGEAVPLAERVAACHRTLHHGGEPERRTACAGP